MLWETVSPVIEVPASFLFDLGPTAAARAGIESNLGRGILVLPLL